MRHAGLALLVAVCACLSTGATALGQGPKIRFDPEDIRIGFAAPPEPGEPADPRGRLSLHKAGCWTPVYVTFTAGLDGVKAGRVTIEATDSDDVQNTYSVPLPSGGVRPNEPATVMAYTKLGSVSGEITVTIQADDKTYEHKKTYDGLPPSDIVYVTIGNRLPGLRRTLANIGDPNTLAPRTRSAYFVQDAQELPNRWFGYQGADLVILTTGQRDFATAFLNERENRKEALAEWVRRGGRLVISCGRNQDLVPKLLAGLGMDFPVRVTEPLHLVSLDAVQAWLPPGHPKLAHAVDKKRPGAAAPPVDVAKLERKPGQDAEVIIPAREDENSPLLMVRAPHGLGQVVLVAFDLDEPPFTSWEGQSDFWKRLQERTRTKPMDVTAAQPGVYRGVAAEANDVAADLERGLENFPEISVISFGWVALFILVYIIIVGPLDYLFLKKVVKRLELTWITFPTVVLIVSAGAYFAAYSLKGNDLKINKLDLVDIDLFGNRSYGTSWFTLFSPRIQLYTVGLEPSLVDTQAAKPEEGGAPATMVSWMGRPDMNYGGYGRARSQSLFRRTYEFEPDATGLKGVPIQVWSAKSFTASWDRPLDPQKPPIQHDFQRRQPAGIEGSLTNQLPAPLEEAVLIYCEGRTDSFIKVYTLGTLQPGESKRIRAGTAASTLAQWVSTTPVGGPTTATTALMKHIMYYDVSAQSGSSDTVLHHLDQSWRKLYQNQAVLIGHLPRAAGTAEEVNSAPAAPSRLWLGQLPGVSTARPALAGGLVQDTYVRVFMPVRPATDEKR
jgi:hypothetical protein